jgi:3-deoxy-D-manno-octulosonate 8-phosphate phosphatase (KDO 8-P phosphatase)
LSTTRLRLAGKKPGKGGDLVTSFKKDVKKAIEKAKKVKLVAHDVHGVLTNNTLFCDVEGRRQYSFLHQDGFGHLSLKRLGTEVAFLDTTSIDNEGLYRVQELKLEKCYYRVQDKMAKLEELERELKISPENVCYVGCDITDIAIMKRVGLAVAPADAIDEVKKVADYVTTASGGRGVIRELCEFVLRAQGKWESWVEEVAKMGYK